MRRASSDLTRGLPGKGHRVVGEAIEFHLDRGDKNVQGAMQRIAAAIGGADDEFTEQVAAQAGRAAKDAERRAAGEARVDRQLSEWWAANRAPDSDGGTAVTPTR